MSFLKKPTWELTHTASIVAVITILTLATRLTGTPRADIFSGQKSEASDPTSTAVTAAHSAPSTRSVQLSSHNAAPSRHSDPREVIVGPSGISSRYTLVRVDRRSVSPARDELIVRLHVESLAMENLVSPFASDMLDLNNGERDPISPKIPFRHPIPSGNSLNQDIVFSVPAKLRLDHTTLQIRYYNYQNEIPLNLSTIRAVE